ncbi:MAG: LysR family transcriptional regulator [Ruminococcus flavefaciens]|nr:LysR family transcriptional regulator [Ruminococcus flavefaciens]
MYSRELTTFISVAEQGSFLKASKELYLTAASVMNQINKLEANVGVRLLERTSQGTQLTAAGHSFYKDAKKIIKQSEQAIARTRQIAKKEKQAIRIGTSILRPCKMLVDLWSGIDDGTLPVTIRIIPFDDSPASMEKMLETLGREIDCFVGPCASLSWEERYNILVLKQGECCIAVPRKHRLAKKEKLGWRDLDGESLMLVKRGDSPIMNRLRDEIETKHPKINILDIPHFYDTNIFNECEQTGCIMETLDIWKDVHPSIVTIPMEWEYKMPYGIVYAKQPSEQMQTFIRIIQDNLAFRG